jgi:hypothetical protein
MPCMCGADDCPRCFPNNFSRIGGRRVYTAEMTEEEVDTLEGQAEDAAIARQEDRDYECA